MLMYPKADIPVVCVSLHSSLSASENMKIGKGLQSLRDEGVFVVGSGYTFHNMEALFHPSKQSKKASQDFNAWLKDTMLEKNNKEEHLLQWESAPGARICHPREEHLLPLFCVAAAADFTTPKLVFDTSDLDESGFDGNFAVSGYLFH
mmetsp:Transcript_4977/g.11172  ORF Transcript_4977/g.11172 Transcript_4977/m.11172 type:complete len:148 (+) Transcript_4977:2-445(+)